MLFFCLKQEGGGGAKVYSAASSAAAFGEHSNHPKRGVHTNDLPLNDPLFQKRSAPLYPSKHFVEFVVTPPARSDRLAEETASITVEDIAQISKEVVGTPLLNEHEAGEVLGRIVSTRIDDKKRIVARVHMEDTEAGQKALENIRNGKVCGASLGQRYVVKDTPDVLHAVTKKMYPELSVTDSPEFHEDAWAISVLSVDDVAAEAQSSSSCSMEVGGGGGGEHENQIAGATLGLLGKHFLARTRTKQN